MHNAGGCEVLSCLCGCCESGGVHVLQVGLEGQHSMQAQQQPAHPEHPTVLPLTAEQGFPQT